MDRGEFWKQVYDEWVSDSDGIDTPPVDVIKIEKEDLEINETADVAASEMEDIFADLGLD